jgi:gluconate 2-dehydrogenase gamma chain
VSDRFTAAEFAALAAVVDRIVPADDFPAGTESGVLEYLESQFGRELAGQQVRYRLGLAGIDAEAQAVFGKPFASLRPTKQDHLLQSIEGAVVRAPWAIDAVAFLEDLVGHVMEGYYGDPSNGGNRAGVSWRMIGFAMTD